MTHCWRLKPETLQMIDNLDKTDWFAHVGDPIEDQTIVQILSWNEAMAYCQSRYCANVQMEGLNLLHERLWDLHKDCGYTDRYKSWNKIVEIVKEYIGPIIDRKASNVIKSYRLPKAFRDTVNWDIMAVCMELEYADLIPPRFFAERAKWYLAGHFPCGWEGDFPVGGKLVVF